MGSSSAGGKKDLSCLPQYGGLSELSPGLLDAGGRSPDRRRGQIAKEKLVEPLLASPLKFDPFLELGTSWWWNQHEISPLGCPKGQS